MTTRMHALFTTASRATMLGLLLGVSAMACAAETAPEPSPAPTATPDTTVTPRLARQEGEVVEVTGCSPGYVELGSGANVTCIPDPSIPNDDPGGGGPSPSGSGGGGGGGSGSGGKKSTFDGTPYSPVSGEPCHAYDGNCEINNGVYSKNASGAWKCGLPSSFPDIGGGICKGVTCEVGDHIWCGNGTHTSAAAL